MFSLIGKLEIGRKIVKNQRLIPLLFGKIFPPKIFHVMSSKNHSNHCKTSFYAVNWNTFSLFRKLEIGRKIVKSRRLTPLLFGGIFRPKTFNVISPKNYSNHSKTSFYAINFHIFTWSRKLEISRKIVKNQRLTPLLYGGIFRPKIFIVFSPKTHSNHCKTRFYAVSCNIFSLFAKLEIGRKIVKNLRLTPLLLDQFFRPKIFHLISPKNHSNHSKTSFYAINYHIFTWSRKLEIGRKIVKNQRLTPLLFGEIFRPKTFNVI